MCDEKEEAEREKWEEKGNKEENEQEGRWSIKRRVEDKAEQITEFFYFQPRGASGHLSNENLTISLTPSTPFASICVILIKLVQDLYSEAIIMQSKRTSFSGLTKNSNFSWGNDH